MVRIASCVTIVNPKVMTKVLGIVYRIIARPAVSTKRLSLTRNGQVRYELKTP